MKNKMTVMAATVAAIVGFASVVQATPISGSIGFTGSYTQVGGTPGVLSTATSMTINTVGIGSTSGALVGATLPTFASPVGVNGNGPSLVGGQLWSVKVGATTYTFTVLTETQIFTSGVQLNLVGTGTLKDGIAADDTLGVFQLGFGVSGAAFEWQSTTGTLVPDGGMTVLLLGAALTGLFLVRKQVLA